MSFLALPSSFTSSLSLDMAFRRILVFSKLYTKSWGDPIVLRDLREYWHQVMSQGKVIDILDAYEKNPMIISKTESEANAIIMEGHFQSPHALEFPKHMPGPLQKAHWRGVFPKNERKGLILHLAGTGDHTYFRREKGFVVDLLKETGTAGIMLDNPFYARRKPPNQFRSSLWNVSDLFVMGAALMAESLYLLRWAYAEGYWPLGISGVSMGGHMACLAASNAVFPVVVAPCLSWTTAAPVFTSGALSCAVPFDEVLQKQLNDPVYREKLEAIPNSKWLDRAKARQEENKQSLARNLMWVLMHDFTDLGQYPVPSDPSLVHSVVAERDYYVLREGTSHLTELWRGATVEMIPERGHVSSYFACHAKFRSAIAGRVEAAQSKYPKPILLS
ncbi:unnamed protein product, partial [Mesorhabditis belari]|uniref:Abhydrolase domain containing 18 n=1 Tax=Mesorhabditis belari TaxID=2138241 RepID=A0AAF3J3R2_9BILA